MTLRGTNRESGRPYNRRIVLESIRLNGPTTRGEIAERVGLTVQTVSTIIRELEEQGYILSEKEEPRGRGLPPTTLRINPEGGYAVGIHVSPLGIDAALVDLAGTVIGNTRRDAAHTTPDEGFTLIRAMVAELKALRPGARMLGAGMALPGPFDVDSMSIQTMLQLYSQELVVEAIGEEPGMRPEELYRHFDAIMSCAIATDPRPAAPRIVASVPVSTTTGVTVPATTGVAVSATSGVPVPASAGVALPATISARRTE